MVHRSPMASPMTKPNYGLYHQDNSPNAASSGRTVKEAVCVSCMEAQPIGIELEPCRPCGHVVYCKVPKPAYLPACLPAWLPALYSSVDSSHP